MRCNPLRWLWGLLPVAALIWLAVIWEKEPIEDDLRQRTEAALKTAGLNWAGAAFDGRDGLLKGLAFNETHPQRAIQVARDVWGVRIVDEDVDVIDLVANYTWAAEKAEDRTTLTGYVPDEDARKTILKEARTRLRNVTVIDDMQLGRGAPAREPLMHGIAFGFDRLSQLQQGRVELAGLNFSIAGEARDYGSYKGVKSALRNAMPAKVQLVQDAVRPPLVKPYTWRAANSGSQLVLEGHTPSEALREELFAKAKEKFANLVIIDRMEPGFGAPETFPSIVRGLLDRLATLENGEASLRDRDLAVRGKAPDKATADRLVAELSRELPEGYRFTHDITYPEPAPPRVSPFTTRINVAQDLVELTGHAPSEAERESLTTQLRAGFEKRRLREEIEIASGAAKNWRQCLDAGLAALTDLGAGSVSLIDDRLTVAGETDDPKQASRVEAIVRSATTRVCNSEVAIRLNLPEEPDLRWQARFDRAMLDKPGRLVLAGEVPDLDTVNELLAEARKRYPDAEIENRMSIAGGFAERWRQVALRGVRLLAVLRSGEARLDGQELTIDGIASDTAAATTVRERLTNNLPETYSGVANIEIKSDAMLWAEIEARRKAQEAEARRKAEAEAEAEARRKAEEEAEAQRKADEEAAARRKADEEAEVRRRTEEEAIARRQAEKEAEARRKAEAETEERARAEAEAAARQRVQDQQERRRKAVEAARRRAEAEAEAQNRRRAEAEAAAKADVEAAAKADVEAAAKAAAQEAAAQEEPPPRSRPARSASPPLPDEGDRRIAAVAPPPEALACTARMSRIVRDGRILFETGEAKIDASSFATLNRLAAAARACPGVMLNVEGHTDSVGGRGDNQELSLRRSEAVIAYLTRVGVARERLRAVGFGEDRPLKPNTSAANRASNRRIEFSLYSQS